MILKIFYISIVILLQAGIALSQDEYMKWPLLGKETGEGIISKPQDYLGDELNYD